MQGDGTAQERAETDRQQSRGSHWQTSRAERAIQRSLDRLYARSKTRYIEVLTVAMVGSIVLFVVPGYTALLIPYFHASGSDYLRYVAAFEIAFTVAGMAMFIYALHRHWQLVKWVRGERNAGLAPRAWESSVALTPGTTVAGLLWYSLCSLPVILYVSATAHLSFWGVLLFLVFMTILFIGVSVFAVLYFEQALAPVTREIAAYLPADFTPRRRTLSLSTKLLVLLPAINLFTGAVVAAVSTNSLGLEGRLAVTLASSLFVTLTLSLVLTLLFRRSLLQRLGGLREAIDRVDSGDYGARVLPLAGDELDAVGRSFNEMAAGLHERALLREALGSYVDEGIAAKVVSEGEVLPGRELEVTILFLDIRDFTSFAAASSAGEVVAFLGGFFDLVIPIVRAHHGHPNKLLGDGLMAVFGAPTALEQHADHALEAAQEIIAAVERRYRGELRIGMGLHSGEVLAGTVGGGGKLDYTLIGDTVNVAARVEELTKELRDPVLLTAATQKRLVRTRDEALKRGPHRLRGTGADTLIFAARASSAPAGNRVRGLLIRAAAADGDGAQADDEDAALPVASGDGSRSAPRAPAGPPL
jgi:adenylate cyclase